MRPPSHDAPVLHGGALPALRDDTLHAALERAAAAGVTIRLLDVERGTDVSLRAILDGAVSAAAALHARGVRRGDAVIVMLPTGEGWLRAFFGTLLAGGVPVPVAPVPVFGDVERTLAIVEHIALDSGARALVTDRRTSGHAKARLGGAPVLEPAELIAPAAAWTPLPTPDPGDTALLQYTSGTTSRPRGVALSHRALLANAFGIGERLGIGPNDAGVSWLPLFHDMGLIGTLLTSLYWHYRLALLPTDSFLLHPHRWLQAIAQERATLSVAPNFAYRLALTKITPRHLEGVSLSTWRAALSGSERVDPETVQSFADGFSAWGYEPRAMTPVYGLAENCLAVTFPPAGEGLRVAQLDREALELERRAVPATDGHASTAVVSVGTPLLGQDVAIRGDDGALLAEGAVGEIVIAGACVMKGYHANEEATADALRDGWLHTGDLGFVSGGRLYVAGRTKELIIRRGRNHYPHDIERAASRVTGGAAAAFGHPNEASGTEDLVLVVECPKSSPEAQGDLEKKIRAEVLAEVGIAVEHVVLRPSRSLPRTTSGKLQRGVVRARWLAERGSA